MSGEIPNVNTQSSQRPSYVDGAADFANGQGITMKAAQVAKAAAAILGGRNITINAGATGPVQEVGTPSGATSIPALDDPSDLKQIEANLEKLLAYLQLDNDQRQAEMAKERIDINKDSFKTEHEERKAKIQKSLDDMESAAKAQKASRIFGWIMAALAVVVAVVACVATGGIAVGAVVGAIVAIGMQAMNEAGVMDKVTESLAKGLESLGMDKKAAQILAALIITAAIIAISVGAGAGAGALASRLGLAAKLTFTVSETVKDMAELARGVMTAVSRFVQVGSVLAGAGAAVTGYEAGMSRADVKETEKFIAMLRQRLEESEEELNLILEAIQNAIGQLAELLSSATDTSAQIASNIGQMA